MPKRLDLCGQQFGRLTVLNDTGNRDRSGFVVWLCRCECGRMHETNTGALRAGKVRSCGCLVADAQRARRAVEKGDAVQSNAYAELAKRNSYLSAEKRRLTEENRQLRARLAGRGAAVTYRPRTNGVEA